MSESEDLIKRAAALPPPTIAEAIELHHLAEWVAEKPKRLERVLRRARDKAAVDNVIAMHGKTGDADWEAAFAGALIRLETVAAMLQAEAAAAPPKRSKRRKKR